MHGCTSGEHAQALSDANEKPHRIATVDGATAISISNQPSVHVSVDMISSLFFREASEGASISI